MSLLSYKNIHFVPSIHQRMAFADEARRTIDEVRPDCIAVELPRFAHEWIVRGALRLPEISVVCYPRASQSGEMFYIPIDPSDSMIEAVRLALEREIEIEWIDTVGAPFDPPPMDLPDDLMIERVGLEAYVKTIIEHAPRAEARSEEEAAAVAERNRAMAHNLARIAQRRRRVVCALGLAHFEAVRRQVESMETEATDAVASRDNKSRGCFLAHVNPESIPELMREVPRVAYLREVDRDTNGEKRRAAFDKLDALRSILSEAEVAYKEQFKIDLSVTQFKALLQFTRNLALAGGRLQPDSYELVVGAKSSVDGDFGYEVYRLARSYRFQSDESSLPALTLHKGRGTFSDREERFLMRPIFGEPETENVKMRFRLRPPERLKEIWKEQWDQVDQRGICSWPPEDERQEKFMTFVRKRALKVVSDDKRQVLEFSTSMLDGLDIRETMRNWHTRKIFVQQAPQPQGRCGAVVVIFADPALDARFSWRCTLYAENQNESDISFYSTPLGAEVVGPRISRTEFGGILSIYPAPQIPDIWRFGLANEFKRCADVLLLAGILFSADKYIAYVADKRPTSQMRSIASHYKKHIIYLPLQGLSVKQLKKVRNFHILSGHDVRSFAGDYIFED